MSSKAILAVQKGYFSGYLCFAVPLYALDRKRREQALQPSYRVVDKSE